MATIGGTLQGMLRCGALLGNGSQQHVGITSAPALQHSASLPQRAGLHGMDGIGKSVLATALAHEPAVRAAFSDGIFRLTISQTPDLLNRQHQLAQALTGQPQVLRYFLEC